MSRVGQSKGVMTGPFGKLLKSGETNTLRSFKKIPLDKVESSLVFTNPEKWTSKIKLLASDQRLENAYPDLKDSYLAGILSSPSRFSKATKISFPRDYSLRFLTHTPQSGNDLTIRPILFSDRPRVPTKYTSADLSSILELYTSLLSVPPVWLTHEKLDNPKAVRLIPGDDKLIYDRFCNDLKTHFLEISEANNTKHTFKGGIDNAMAVLSFETPTTRSVFLHSESNKTLPVYNMPYILQYEADLYRMLKTFFITPTDSNLAVLPAGEKYLLFTKALHLFALFKERFLFLQTKVQL